MAILQNSDISENLEPKTLQPRDLTVKSDTVQWTAFTILAMFILFYW